MSPTPKMCSKGRLLCFNEADAHDFGEALRERFPRIRFRMFGYTDLQCRPAAGEQPRLDIPLYESLGDSSEWRFLVWIEPEGWEPEWEGPNKNNLMVITNKPVLQFVYDSSRRIPPPDGNNLRPGQIWAYYRADDKECARFLNAVWRISARLSTNVLDVLDRKTGKVNYKATRTMIWAGYHALDWCRADPAHFIDENIRPTD